MVAAAALALLHLLLATLAFTGTFDPGGDNAAYIALGRSLLEHGRYLELWDPSLRPHLQYPPGFPAFLAAAMAAGIHGRALNLLMLPVSALAVGLSVIWLGRRRTPEPPGGSALFAVWAPGLVLALAPGVLALSPRILSDVPFWAAVMAALVAFERDRPGAGIALSLVALALRMAALPLVAAAALWLAFGRRWRAVAAMLVALAVVVGLWWLRGRGAAVPYVSEMWLENPYVPEGARIGALGLVRRVSENALAYGVVLLPRTLLGVERPVAVVAVAMMVALALAGWASRLARPGVAEPFVPLYVGMLLVWPPGWASDRFLLPLLPLVLGYAAAAVLAMPSRRVRMVWALAGTTILLALMARPDAALLLDAAGCRTRIRAAGSPAACLDPAPRSFIDLARWSRGRLPSGAVVISRKPRLFYHFAGAPGRHYPFTADPDSLLAEAEALKARYVVVDEIDTVSPVYLLPAVRRHEARFCEVHRVTEGGSFAILLGVLPPGEAAASPTELPAAGTTAPRQARSSGTTPAHLPGGAPRPSCPAGYLAS